MSVLEMPPGHDRYEEGPYWSSMGPTCDPVESTLFGLTMRYGLEDRSLQVRNGDRDTPCMVYRSCHSSEGEGLIGFPFQGGLLDDDDMPRAEFVAAARNAAATQRALELRDEMLGDDGLRNGVPDRLRSVWQFQVHKLVAHLVTKGTTPAQRLCIMDIDRRHWKHAVAYRSPGAREFRNGYGTETLHTHTDGGSGDRILWGFRLRGLHAYAQTVSLPGDRELTLEDDESGTRLIFLSKTRLPETIVNSMKGRDVCEAVRIPHVSRKRLGIRIESLTQVEMGSGWYSCEIRLEDVVDRIVKPPRSVDMSWCPDHSTGHRGIVF